MRLNCSVCMDSWRDERNMTRTSHSPVGSAMVKCIAMAVIDMRIIFPVTKTYPMIAGTKGLVPCANLAQGLWSKILLTNILAHEVFRVALS